MGSSAFDQNSAKKGRRKHGSRSNAVVRWLDIDSELLVKAIHLVARSGGALRFGLTRDQGAFAVGIYGEGDPYTEYFHDVQDCESLLREIIADYGEDAQPASK